MNFNPRNPAAMAAIAAVILLIAGPGYWFFNETRKDAQRKEVAQVVSASSKSLGLAISMRGAEGELAQLDAIGKETDAQLAALKGLPKRYEPPVVEAAEQYVVDAQRIVKRQANLVRVRATTATAQNALMQHMGRAESRSDEWIREAVALRKKLEGEFFEYRAAATAFASALEAMPASRRLAGETVMGASFYDEAALGKLRTRAAEDAKIATEELAALKRLPPPR
jgi:hypothetical protein